MSENMCTVVTWYIRVNVLFAIRQCGACTHRKKWRKNNRARNDDAWKIEIPKRLTNEKRSKPKCSCASLDTGDCAPPLWHVSEIPNTKTAVHKNGCCLSTALYFICHVFYVCLRVYSPISFNLRPCFAIPGKCLVIDRCPCTTRFVYYHFHFSCSINSDIFRMKQAQPLCDCSFLVVCCAWNIY